jgi:hypothetical protein
MKGRKVLACPTIQNLAVSPVSFKNEQTCLKQEGIFVCHTVKNMLYKKHLRTFRAKIKKRKALT